MGAIGQRGKFEVRACRLTAQPCGQWKSYYRNAAIRKPLDRTGTQEGRLAPKLRQNLTEPVKAGENPHIRICIPVSYSTERDDANTSSEANRGTRSLEYVESRPLFLSTLLAS